MDESRQLEQIVNNMKLSIIIPAYNEEHRIKKTLLRVDYFLRRSAIDAEVIVVDDGSSDRTAEIVQGFSQNKPYLRLMQNVTNRGKGYSVRRGVAEARGEYVLFADADNSTPIQEVKKLLPYLISGKIDVAIGSRSMKGSRVRVRQPWPRSMMGKIFNKLVKLFLYRDFVDTQCGFKCFTHRAACDIFSVQRFDRFSFDIEVLAIAKLKCYRIKEVPIVWVNSLKSRVSPFKDAFRMFCDIFRLKFNIYKGKYK